MFFTNPESMIFFTKCVYKVSFSVMISSFLISIKKSYLEEKLNKFREQKFVDSGIVKTCDEIDL